MTLLIAVTGWDVSPWIERFRGVMPDRAIVSSAEPFDPAAITYVATWKHQPHSLAPLKNLKAIFSLGAGVDHLFADPGLPDVPIARIVDPDLTARMSEYVVLHCLIYLRQQRLYDQQQKEKIWADDRFQPAASDMRVGIMGMGELGRDAAAKLCTMGFQVRGWNRSTRAVPGVTMFSGQRSFGQFLEQTDILVTLLPLTDETRGIINRDLLRGLARDGRLGGPVLINAGRGGLQNEADILACLNDGTLLGATLDVFQQEPLPQASPLWSHPRVTVTPHNAAMSNPDTIGQQIADQIAAYERGEPLANQVDPARQY